LHKISFFCSNGRPLCRAAKITIFCCKKSPQLNCGDFLRHFLSVRLALPLEAVGRKAGFLAEN
jgi:hypothetical protein